MTFEETPFHSGQVLSAIEQTDRSVKLNQVHSALQRLEEKGMVKSEVGGATAERGGRRKRLYTVTAHGEATLQQIQHVRESFWSRLINPLKPALGL